MQNKKLHLYPELLRFEDGTAVASPMDWKRRRKEILRILSEQEYGFTPEAPKAVRGTVNRVIRACCAGHGLQEEITLSFDTPNGEFSFPIHFFISRKEERTPVFVFLNFRSDAYDRYLPVEEVIDNGFSVVSVNYQDITSDNGDFSNGISALYPRNEENTAWGKIGMWAFCASRIVDYLFMRTEIDTANIAVIGHSRLGKAALWCGAQDERIRYVISNDSGCSGAAYERLKHEGAETIDAIAEKFSFWFCKNYLKYRKAPEARNFDQHFLLALQAPRYLAVGSASLDLWADPYSEQISCIGASPAWKLFGLDGYIGDETPAKVGDCFGDGQIQYHLRDGIHYFSRADWGCYMNWIRKIIQGSALPSA